MKFRRAMLAQVAGVLGAKRRGVAGNRPEQPLGYRFARRLLVIIVLVNITAAASLWVVGAHASADRASNDLVERLTTIQSLLREGGLLEVPQLSLMRAQVAAAEADLNTLRSATVFAGIFNSPSEARLNHATQVAADFLGAVDNLLNASAVIQPSLTAVLVSALGATPEQAGNGLLPKQSTISAISVVRSDVRQAQTLWQSAWAELKTMSTSSVGSPKSSQASSINAITSYMTHNAHDLDTVFTTTVAVLNTIPFLLGISIADHSLMLYLDPNQLTPTGGTATSYAVIEISGGQVLSHVQFQSTLALDCARTCVRNGLSQVNLSPDFVDRAKSAEAALMSEAGIKAHSVIAITPNLIRDLLAIGGPIRVPELGTTISAGNLFSENASYDQRIALQARRGRGTRADTSGFPIALMNAITQALAHASHDELLRIGATLSHALTTKDLLLYTDYYSIELQMATLDIGGRVFYTAARDSLYVMDADVGGSVNRSAISETISDNVTLSSTGTITHTLSIQYTYAANKAPPDPYHNLVQVIVPPSAFAMATTGPCTTTPVMAVSNHQALACGITLNPGASATVHMSWRYRLSSSSIAMKRYELILQRQPGAEVVVRISLTPAAGVSLLPASPNEHTAKGHIVWEASPLLEDTDVSANFTGIG